MTQIAALLILSYLSANNAAVTYLQLLANSVSMAFWEQDKKTPVSQIERCDGLDWRIGEVLIRQNVIKTNLKTAGSYE